MKNVTTAIVKGAIFLLAKEKKSVSLFLKKAARYSKLSGAGAFIHHMTARRTKSTAALLGVKARTLLGPISTQILTISRRPWRRLSFQLANSRMLVQFLCLWPGQRPSFVYAVHRIDEAGVPLGSLQSVQHSAIRDTQQHGRCARPMRVDFEHRSFISTIADRRAFQILRE